MVVLCVRLVGEEKDRLFAGIEFDTEISFVDLKKELETITQIPARFLEIQFQGDCLPVVEHPLRDVQFGQELIVKHTSLLQWQNYLTIVQKFREAKENRSRQERAVEANEQAKQLYDVKFFSAYATFYSGLLRMREEYAVFLDNIPDFIKEAAKTYFTRKFYDKLIDVDFKDKPSGSRSGAMCIVSFDAYRRVFYIKTNHNASSISFTHRGPLNMIELFLYKLLEEMNIGAVIDFIPNLVSSSKIVYICSEEVPGFRTLAMLEKEWDNFERKIVKQKEEISKAIIQISLLAQILGLDDLNAENIGFIENTFSLYIVDFRTGFIDSSIGFEDINRPKTTLSLVAQLRMNLGRFLELVKGKTYEEQLRIVKEFIVQSGISLKLDVALAKLNEDKEVFRRTDLLFNKGTEALNEYINIVREKIIQIHNL
ncbi:unnamed protein product [Auanema sp. JU1783]|nr:unnamed protein product [Auanema sp. JU1783]